MKAPASVSRTASGGGNAAAWYAAPLRPRWDEAATRRERDPVGAAAALLCAATLLAGYWTESWMVLWSALPVSLWLALERPVRLVGLLVFTTPIFPVVRLTQDLVGAQRVSTKGLFLSCDDPLVAGLLVGWLCAHLRRPEARRQWFPGALGWLLLVYPLAIAGNAARLDTNQLIVSGLYYCKWAEYALLLFVVPQTLTGRRAQEVAAKLPRSMALALLLSTLYAGYEVAESLRTGSYTVAASFPRASSFFGTLDPLRYGASEDPVNFGSYAMVAGAVALAWMGSGRAAGWMPGVTVASSVASLVLSASRAPWLAAMVAFSRVYRIRSSRVLLGMLMLAAVAVVTYVAAPGLWNVTASRFEAIGDWQRASERSAVDRLEIATHSPVLDVDQYWLLGHGHSSYRFIADEHSTRVTGGISRSLYNFLLTAWYDAGPAGLVLWILLAVQLNRRFLSIQSGSPSPPAQILARGLRGALLGIATAAMFGEVPYNWRVMGVFYLAAGVCLAADRAARRQPPSPLAVLWRVG